MNQQANWMEFRADHQQLAHTDCCAKANRNYRLGKRVTLHQIAILTATGVYIDSENAIAGSAGLIIAFFALGKLRNRFLFCPDFAGSIRWPLQTCSQKDEHAYHGTLSLLDFSANPVV